MCVCVCVDLTNITVLRLFFLFTTLPRCVWSGGAKWTLLMRPEKGLEERGGGSGRGGGFGRGSEAQWGGVGKGRVLLSFLQFRTLSW